MSGLTKCIRAVTERGDFESRLWRISKIFVKESLSVFSSKYRADGIERPEVVLVGCGWYVAAAVVILAVALSFYMSNYISSEKEGKTLIQPGTQQAQLTLSDGSVIDVHRKEVSVVVDGVQVKYKKGVLFYQPTVTTQHEEKNIEEQSGKSNELVYRVEVKIL